ncbi:MAG: polyphenol oxidase family protein, partial [Thermoleophilaceae bacterium]|nr:polyphenol oxidase family protein [Thermoleophilaceae bacterium]
TTADCFPVAMASDVEVAVLHCGWRGLAAGIVERCVAAFHDAPKYAAVGPGIGQQFFEVGADVVEAFGDLSAQELVDSRIDLRAVVERKLRAAGVSDVAHAAFCTYADERFFSYRRSTGPTGRQAGIAWLN